MILESLNGEQFLKLVTNGALNLKENYEEVDSLNVFPVPDGDTGTNMLRTISGGLNIAKNSGLKDLSTFAGSLSKGMVMSARGNSGVILSQIFRGICIGFDGKSEVNVLELAEAFKLGVKHAYSAVVNPVEGTILTVFREATEETIKSINQSSTINEFFEIHLKKAMISLNKTPDLLPVLKEAGVIDSGGAGYVFIIKGFLKYLDGEKIEAELEDSVSNNNVNSTVDFSAFSKDDELEFGYCTEFILRLQTKKTNIDNFDVNSIINELESDDIKGESIVALKDDDIVKVHVHTHEPGIVLHKMRKFGEFLTIKVENMALQHNENLKKEEQKKSSEFKKHTLVAVASGVGLVNQFKEFGVDVVISGGQTMNPSTEDFLKAFRTLNTENIFVFPNNKNIIMAAKQAASMYKKANVVVIESTSIPQCFSALTMLDLSSDDADLIKEGFNETIKNVVTGEITTSIRDTKVNGINILKDDNIAIVDGKIVCSTTNNNEIVSLLLGNVPEIEDKYMVTIIFGEDVDENEKQNNLKKISEKFPNLEIVTCDGGQAIYKYLLAVE